MSDTRGQALAAILEDAGRRAHAAAEELEEDGDPEAAGRVLQIADLGPLRATSMEPEASAPHGRTGRRLRHQGHSSDTRCHALAGILEDAGCRAHAVAEELEVFMLPMPALVCISSESSPTSGLGHTHLLCSDT